MRELKVLNEKRTVTLVEDESTGVFLVCRKLIKEQTELYQILKRHSIPHVPPVVQVEQEEDGTFREYEMYFNGIRLDRMLEEGLLSPEKTRLYVMQLCEALSALHEIGIVHRDIKPGNIMVSRDGQLYLIDFDIARFERLGAGQDTQLLGTKGYAAPEQYGFSQTSAQTDIYAAGVLMNVMTCGELPGDRLADNGLTPIIRKCVMMDPSDRFKSAEELRRKLESADLGERRNKTDRDTDPASRGFRADRKKQRRRGVTLLVIVLLIAAGVVIGGLLILQGRREKAADDSGEAVNTTQSETEKQPETDAQSERQKQTEPVRQTETKKQAETALQSSVVKQTDAPRVETAIKNTAVKSSGKEDKWEHSSTKEDIKYTSKCFDISPKYEPLQVAEIGYKILSNEFDERVVSFGMILTNPNEFYSVHDINVQVTGKDAQGLVLGTDELPLGGIAMNDTNSFAGTAYFNDSELLETVEFRIIANKYSFKSLLIPYASDFSADGVVLRGEGWEKRITGTVSTTAKRSMSRCNVNIIYKKDGRIICGDSGDLSDLEQGVDRPFEVYTINMPDDYDTYEISFQRAY